jgi:hypothetical protein
VANMFTDFVKHGEGGVDHCLLHDDSWLMESFEHSRLMCEKWCMKMNNNLRVFADEYLSSGVLTVNHAKGFPGYAW